MEIITVKSPKSTGGYKYEKTSAIKSVVNSGGIMSIIAERLGVDRTTVSAWLKDEKKKVFAEAVQSEKERVLDVAESNIIRLIVNGDPKMTTWFLSVKGGERGYVPKQKVEVSNMPVQVLPLDNDNSTDTKTDGSLKGSK